MPNKRVELDSRRRRLRSSLLAAHAQRWADRTRQSVPKNSPPEIKATDMQRYCMEIKYDTYCFRGRCLAV